MYVLKDINFINSYTEKVGAIDRAHARSTSARNVLLTVRMRTDRAHAPPPSEQKCMKV